MIGYVAMCSFRTLGTPAWNAMAWLSFFVWGLVGILIGEATVVMALAVVDVLKTDTIGDEGGTTVGRNSDGDHHFMQRFLRCKVTPEAAADIERAVTFARQQVVIYAMMQGFVYLGLLVPRLRNPDYLAVSLQDGSVFAVCLGFFGTIPFAMVLSGWLLFVSVPSRVVEDRIHMHVLRLKRLVTLPAAHIQASTAEVAVRKTHHDCLMLAALLHPPLKVAVLGAIIGAGYYLTLSVCPRDDVDPAALAYKGFTRVFTPPVFFCAAICTAPAGIWPMRRPADVSEATNRLVAAVVELRRHLSLGVEKEHASGEATIADQLSKIDELIVQTQQLNGGAGLGFVIWGTQVQPPMVRQCTLAVVGCVAITAAVMSRLWRPT
jgi:hypothetical protein